MKGSLSRRAFAMPVALLLLLILGFLGLTYSKAAQVGLVEESYFNARDRTFLAAEGSLALAQSMLASDPLHWSKRLPLFNIPSNYQSYDPLFHLATNGIPPCSGLFCERSLIPITGGLIKNYGPLTGEGSLVDTTQSVIDQLDLNAPPAADIIFGDVTSWFQLERLHEVNSWDSRLHTDLENNPQDLTKEFLYRINAMAISNVRQERTVSELVSIVRVPVN